MGPFIWMMGYGVNPTVWIHNILMKQWTDHSATLIQQSYQFKLVMWRNRVDHIIDRIDNSGERTIIFKTTQKTVKSAYKANCEVKFSLLK